MSLIAPCISVIIPLYNAQNYIASAIKSALNQPEVKEIIVIDDGSKDGSYSICTLLAQKQARIITLKHSGHANLGPGASRNLGLEKATGIYVTFLDADDYYLPNRYDQTFNIFQLYPTLDGVYETVQDIVLDSYNGSAFPDYHGVRQDIYPDNSLEAIINNTYGLVQLGGFTFNREFLIENSIFFSPLYGGEDMHLIFEACIHGNILLKSSPPRVIRQLHDTNLTLNKTLAIKNATKASDIWFQKIFQYNMSKSTNRYFFKQFLQNRSYIQPIKNKAVRLIIKFFLSLFLIVRHPTLIYKLWLAC